MDLCCSDASLLGPSGRRREFESHWGAGLLEAPADECPTFCLSILAPCYVAMSLRHDILTTGTRTEVGRSAHLRQRHAEYQCCQGEICIAPGAEMGKALSDCGISPNGQMILEAYCCTLCSSLSTRSHLARKYGIREDPCLNRVRHFSQLACCLAVESALASDERKAADVRRRAHTEHPFNCVAYAALCCLLPCLHAQAKFQLHDPELFPLSEGEREADLSSNVLQRTVSRQPTILHDPLSQDLDYPKDDLPPASYASTSKALGGWRWTRWKGRGNNRIAPLPYVAQDTAAARAVVKDEDSGDYGEASADAGALWTGRKRHRRRHRQNHQSGKNQSNNGRLRSVITTAQRYRPGSTTAAKNGYKTSATTGAPDEAKSVRIGPHKLRAGTVGRPRSVLKKGSSRSNLRHGSAITLKHIKRAQSAQGLSGPEYADVPMPTTLDRSLRRRIRSHVHGPPLSSDEDQPTSYASVRGVDWRCPQCGYISSAHAKARKKSFRYDAQSYSEMAYVYKNAECDLSDDGIAAAGDGGDGNSTPLQNPLFGWHLSTDALGSRHPPSPAVPARRRDKASSRRKHGQPQQSGSGGGGVSVLSAGSAGIVGASRGAAAIPDFFSGGSFGQDVLLPGGETRKATKGSTLSVEGDVDKLGSCDLSALREKIRAKGRALSSGKRQASSAAAKKILGTLDGQVVNTMEERHKKKRPPKPRPRRPSVSSVGGGEETISSDTRATSVPLAPSPLVLAPDTPLSASRRSGRSPRKARIRPAALDDYFGPTNATDGDTAAAAAAAADLSVSLSRSPRSIKGTANREKPLPVQRHGNRAASSVDDYFGGGDSGNKSAVPELQYELSQPQVAQPAHSRRGRDKGRSTKRRARAFDDFSYQT